MVAFATLDDLRRSLQQAGLGAKTDAIAATARSALLFVRRSVDDDALPAGAATPLS